MRCKRKISFASFAESCAESIGLGKGSVQRAFRFCKLLSPEERTRLKGTAAVNSDKDLHSIAGIGDTQKRAEVISALSDTEKPVPSLHEEKQRAGLVQPARRDLTKEIHREACLLFDGFFVSG